VREQPLTIDFPRGSELASDDLDWEMISSTCLRCGREHSRKLSLLCEICASDARLAQEDHDRSERLEKREYFRGTPVAPTEDDWRPSLYARARLRRPYRLFPAEMHTWERIGRVPRSGGWDPPQATYYEHGLWPAEFMLAHVELKEAVEEALRTLKPREELVLRMLFGIRGSVVRDGESLDVDEGEMSQAEIANGLRRSKSRVQQTVQFALWKLGKLKSLEIHYGDQGRFHEVEEDRDDGDQA
jgi:hypothetical protein